MYARSDVVFRGYTGLVMLNLSFVSPDPKWTLIRRLDAGGLDESWRQQPGTPVYAKDVDVNRVRRALSEACKDPTPEWRASANSPGTFAAPA